MWSLIYTMFKSEIYTLPNDKGELRVEGTAYMPLDNAFDMVYTNLINEWNKTLFVPYPLLQDIIVTILNTNFKYRN